MIKDNQFITIQSFMVNKLHLKANELLFYAVIYGFSQDNKSVFQGTSSYFTEWFGLDKKTVLRILKNLTDKGLIIKIEKEINGVKLNDYKINFDKIDNTMSPGVAKCPQGWQNVPTLVAKCPLNNIKENNIKENNIKENNIKLLNSLKNNQDLELVNIYDTLKKLANDKWCPNNTPQIAKGLLRDIERRTLSNNQLYLIESIIIQYVKKV